MDKNIKIVDDKVKNLIIKILSDEWPLTAKKIYNRVTKRYRKNVTYQAVFKALKEMKNKNMVKKEGYDYSLNPVWLNEIANFYEGIKKSYESKPKNYLSKILKEQSFTLEFENNYDGLQKTLEVCNRLTFLTKKDDYLAFTEVPHMPWVFCGTDEEHKKIRETAKKFNGLYVLCHGNTPGDKAVRDHFKDFDNIHILLGQEKAKDHATSIGGNMVAQIFYPEEFNKKVDKIYENFKGNFEESISKMSKLLYNECYNGKAVITRNKEFARIKKKQFKKIFNKEGIEIPLNI